MMRSSVHRLPVEGPLDLSLTFSCGQAFRWREEAGAWTGIVAGGEWRVTAEEGLIRVEVLGEDPGAGAIRRYLRLDESPERHLRHAEELRAIPGFTDLLGMRLLRQEPWETLISFICSAASNVRKISTGVEGMAARWGDPIEGSARRSFPAPATLARVRERDLRTLGVGFRAPYVLAAARAAANGGIAWEALRAAPIEEARAGLQALPGVGPKIADCVLLFGLDRLDTYPVDRWIRRATMELASRRRARDEELEAWSRRLGPSRGYLQQILFHLRRTGGPLPALERRRAGR
ncbi:MAG TPA: DNA glycosylase [Candidatus Eisenbacteria bacterium]|nr:DNA glycosylase [Candidatus Eisenbacteria bacterium]